ncbi:Flp family type IVb pilin [Acidocella sp.]|jgi:pilus assembly protein Flp/PilA|uniref:Flp family type IVb pilin n=1 Tax=Acidocella sp. TaxID=50710 RepID=UPI0026104186|nr:Flp family type IVb pilin [Acidocella sp.]
MLVSLLRTRLAMATARLGLDRRAVTSLEYAIIAAVMVVAVVGGAKSIGGSLASSFGQVASEL